MNEIEMAIDAIGIALAQDPPAAIEQGYGFYLVIEDALATALAALREQAEREKGCEWCTGALPEDITPHREFFKNMLKGWSEDWLCVAKKVPSGEHILHCEIDTALTDFSADIPIRFCPMCGRRLEVEQDV